MSGRRSGLLLAAALLLSGCAATALSEFSALDYFQGDVNMAEKNYAAADYLISRARPFAPPGSSIKAVPLLDEEEPRLTAPLGREIPEQIGRRLGELGYNVDLISVATGLDPAYQPAYPMTIHEPQFLLGGSYRRGASDIKVRLRLQETASGIERAAYDFTLPRRAGVRKGTKPEPLIIQTGESGGLSAPAEYGNNDISNPPSITRSPQGRVLPQKFLDSGRK